MGFPEAVLHLRCTAPVAHVVVRLTDVAPDGTSSQVAIGILNLTHRAGQPQKRLSRSCRARCTRARCRSSDGLSLLPGQRIRLSVASAAWPIVWPSPYPAGNFLHTGPQTPSRLLLPVLPPSATLLPPPAFKTEIPTLPEVGEWRGEPPVGRSRRTCCAVVTVRVRDGDETTLPDGTVIFTAEELEMTARHDDPAHVLLLNRVVYRLVEHGYAIEVRADGGFRSPPTPSHFDVRLEGAAQRQPLLRASWLESVPRRLV